jgi:hypothetical protein
MLVEPSVSTLERRFIRAFLPTIFFTEAANARVTVGIKPSGTLATVSPIAKRKATDRGSLTTYIFKRTMKHPLK